MLSGLQFVERCHTAIVECIRPLSDDINISCEMTTRPANSRNREVNTSGGTTGSSPYTESSPLFREYGPCEVKESPIFLQQGTSKYGSACRLMDNGTRRLIPSKNPLGPASAAAAAASFAFPSVSRTKSQRKPATTKQGSSASGYAKIGGKRADSPVENTYRDASNEEGFHDRDNTSTETSSVSVRTRQPPQTQLESLGSTHTWILLFLPALSAIAVLFFHPNCVSSSYLTSASCVEPFHCAVFPSDLTDSMGNSLSTLRILLEQPIATVNFIDSSMQIDDSETSKGRRLKYENTSANFLRITNKLFTASLRDLKCTSGDSQKGSICYNDSIDKLSASSETLVSYSSKTYAYVSVLNDPINLLEVRSLSRAGHFHGGNRYPVLDITIVPIYTEMLKSVSRRSKLLYHSEHENENENENEVSHISPLKSNLTQGASISQNRKRTSQISLQSSDGNSVDDIKLTFVSQSRLFSVWSAVLILSLSTLSCIMMIIFYSRAYSNIYNNIRLQKKLLKSVYCSCNWMKFLHPEQFHGFGLLFAIIFWLNPMQSVLNLMALALPSIESPDYWMFVSKLTESLGRQGQ
jgi:hypothetical protein